MTMAVLMWCVWLLCGLFALGLLLAVPVAKHLGRQSRRDAVMRADATRSTSTRSATQYGRRRTRIRRRPQ